MTRPSRLFAIALAVVVGGLAAVAAAARPADEVKLDLLKYDAFLAKIAANKEAKFTLVDAWATWCAPCKENFPHLVEMHKKYASKGLAVVSVSLDDPEKPKALEEARKFLKEQGATFLNVVLDESADDAFGKLNIQAIPAVFLFGPDGKEIKRFTLDDVDNQFTYEQVEKEVRARLGVKD